MIRHIVMFKIRENYDDKKATEAKELLIKELNSLSDKIKITQNLKTGLNISDSPRAYDILLEVNFDTKEELEEYRVHPAHKAVVELIKIHSENSIVVDYEF